MVRVNHPPGGQTRILSETQREPKTVRILKPPGGESSISFTDDEGARRLQRNVAHDSSMQTASSPTPSSSSSEEAPNFNGDVDKDPAAATPKSPEPAKPNGTVRNEFHKEPSPVRQSPSPSLENTCVEANTESEAIVSCSDSIETASTATSNDLISSASTEVTERSVNVSCKEISSVSESSRIAENKIYVESSEKFIATQIGCEDAETQKENGVSHESEIEGKEKISLAPLTIHDNRSPSNTSPSSPLSPSSPSARSSEPTKERIIGQPPAGTPSGQSPQPRKIKDHMRSNIFMSDEDYTPSRSSRMNASVTTDSPPQTVPAAGQRQRIPPGGFSTKLW